MAVVVAVVAGGRQLEAAAAKRDRLRVQQVDVDRPLAERIDDEHRGDRDRVAPGQRLVDQHPERRQRQHRAADHPRRVAPGELARRLAQRLDLGPPPGSIGHVRETYAAAHARRRSRGRGALVVHARPASSSRRRKRFVSGSLRVVEHLLGRADLEQPALVQEADPVGDLAGEAHLVGGDQHRHALVLERPHRREHLADELGIERRGDLVEQHRPRPRGERARQRDALLLAAGELVGPVVLAPAEAEALELRAGRRLGLGARDAVAAPAAEDDVLEHASGGGRGCRPGRRARAGGGPRPARPRGR